MGGDGGGHLVRCRPGRACTLLSWRSSFWKTGPTLVRALLSPMAFWEKSLHRELGRRSTKKERQSTLPAPPPNIRVLGRKPRVGACFLSDGKCATISHLFWLPRDSGLSMKFPIPTDRQYPQQLIRTFHTSRTQDIYIWVFSKERICPGVGGDTPISPITGIHLSLLKGPSLGLPAVFVIHGS